MSLKKVTIILMVVTVVSKVLGFFREVMLSYYYGASVVSDAYLVALTIPGVVFAFIGTAIATGFIPIYSKVIESGRDENLFINNLLSISHVISTLLVVVTVFFAEEIVYIFAPGFPKSGIELAVNFTQIFVVGIYASAMIMVFTAYLQIKKSFVAAAFAGVPFNVATLLSIYLSAKFNLYWLIVGAVMAKVIELFFLAPYLKRAGYRFRAVLDFKDRDIRSMVLLSVPLVLGVSVNQINVLVDKSLASSVAIGGVSALNYAYHINQFVIGVFVVSVATVAFPSFSRQFVSGDIDGLRGSFSRTVNAVSILLVPCAAYFVFFADEIVSVVYGRGKFDADAQTMTSAALVAFSLGMLGFGYREILSRVFYSMHDTKTPVINATLGVVINIVLSFALSPIMGVAGLALATSISATVTSALLFYKVRKQLSCWGARDSSVVALKVLISSMIAVGAAQLAISVGALVNPVESLIVGSLVGAILCFISMYLLGVQEIKIVLINACNKLKTR